MYKKIISLCVLICGILFSTNIISNAMGDQDDFVIVLDPGHGGVYSGASRMYDGEEILEKNLNIKIAKYLQNELESYKTSDGRDVVVYLTHENIDGSDVSLKARTDMAKELNAEVLISLHNNATEAEYEEIANGANGAMVLVTNSHYIAEGSKHENLYDLEENLALSILKELNSLGISVSESHPMTNDSGADFDCPDGLLRRICKEDIYPNYEKCDWYSIVRESIKNGIPGIIVEHAYLNNPGDYYNFLNSDEKLENLALADARGIANYYGFEK